MVEPIFAPPHADTFEALLNEPFTCTFHHPGAQRYTQRFVRRVIDVVAMAMQVCIHLFQRLARRLRNVSISKASASAPSTASGSPWRK